MTATEHDLVSDAKLDRRHLRLSQDLAAGIAHELRNPVFAIASAARLLRFRVADDPVVERNIGRILREAERLNGFVSALLDYGRPAPIRLAPADPDDVWDDVFQAERGALESKALIVRHRAAAPRVVCEIDAQQLAQAYTQMLANAIDAAPEGSDLILNATVLANGDWRCELRNEGPPVSQEVLPHVFDLLVSTKPGHAGVGLALAQRIVLEHGGTIVLHSDATQGTIVTLMLPSSRGGG